MQIYLARETFEFLLLHLLFLVSALHIFSHKMTERYFSKQDISHPKNFLLLLLSQVSCVQLCVTL